MTLFERIEAIEPAITNLQTAVTTLQNTPATDVSALTAAIAAVKTEADNTAALVGTPAAPQA